MPLQILAQNFKNSYLSNLGSTPLCRMPFSGLKTIMYRWTERQAPTWLTKGIEWDIHLQLS